MFDSYYIPALVLTAFLLPVFGHLYRRYRDTRTLLWFLGFLFAIVRMVLFYRLPWWDFSDVAAHPWMAAVGEMSIQISAAVFLASLSPLSFRVGRFKLLYVVPFALPLVIYAALIDGFFHGISPHGHLFLIFPALGLLSLIAAFFWGIAGGTISKWLGAGACILLGAVGLGICFAAGAGWPLTYVECADRFITALLLIFVFRRISPGVVLSVLGFLAWSLTILEIFPFVAHNPGFDLGLVRLIIMGKVVAALGLIVLALEDEVATNKAAQTRERRARQELEAYSNLILFRRRVEDFDRQGSEICQTVVKYSRFAQAALLLQTAGKYRLAGIAGLDPATATALESLAPRIPVAGFLAAGSAPLAVEHSQTLLLNLEPWLNPGDDLKRLRFTTALALPLAGRSATEGALLLGGMRILEQSLHSDDVMPVEMLTARLQAVRSQTMMLEKLIDSEKFAGLGQLAGNVTQQLNNPLTVILGYASLLDETSSLDPKTRKAVESILNEARRMRSTLESLSRISRRQNDQLAAVSIEELLADMEQLHRTEFLRRSIDFRLSIAPGLPKVLCHAQQLRQAVLHCLQFAIEAADSQGTAASADRTGSGSPLKSQSRPETKSVRLEATREGNVVQILVSHSGPGFLYPERAFDPFVPSQATGETAGLGLGLCATILREHNGRASAINLEPRGAAIILELQAA
jgi:signal transduction histidine kinase